MYEISAAIPGKLIIMPKPSSDWLHEDMRFFKEVGITTIVSLLERSEENELGLRDEATVSEQSGIEFVRFPIPDRGLPNSETFGSLIDDLAAKLSRGEKVAVHCRAGIGRSGVVVCAVLVRLGYSADEALNRTSNARGVQVPDTIEQKTYIGAFADKLNNFK